jgi:hypothetical protein
MPRFFFDVSEGGRLIPHSGDPIELADPEEAQREAAQVATEIARDELPQGCDGEVQVQVRNDYGQLVLTVTVSIEIEWEPAPWSRRR